MTAPDERRHAPSRAWYIVALAAMAIGPLGLAWSRWSAAGLASAESRGFLAPGDITFNSVAGAQRSLYHLPGAAHDAHDPDAPAGLPDEITITLIDLTRGVEIPVEPALGRRTRVGGVDREEIARFRTARDGPHRLEVSGPIPEMRCALGPPDSAAPVGAPDWLATAASAPSAWRAATNIALYALTAAGAAAGLITIAVTLLLRHRARLRPPPPLEKEGGGAAAG